VEGTLPTYTFIMTDGRTIYIKALSLGEALEAFSKQHGMRDVVNVNTGRTDWPIALIELQPEWKKYFWKGVQDENV